MLEHRCPAVWSCKSVIRVHCLGWLLDFWGVGWFVSS